MDTYKMHFEDLPTKNRKAVGRPKVKTMAKTTNEAQKPSKKYAKSRAEHYKDIAIAVLITGIVAFIAGAQFASSHQAEIDRAVQAVTPTAQAEGK